MMLKVIERGAMRRGSAALRALGSAALVAAALAVAPAWAQQKVSVDFGLSFANPDHDLRQSNAGVTLFDDDGSDGSTVTSLGIDWRYTFGSPYNVNGTGTNGFRSGGPVAGAWGRVFFGGDDQNDVWFDLHPTPGNDTRAMYSKDAFILPYVGWQFGLGQHTDVTLFGGPRIEWREGNLWTNEGTVSEFSNSEVDLGFTIGFDIDFPIFLFNIGNLGNVGNVGNVGNTGMHPFFRLGAALDYSPDLTVKGRSAGGFDYRHKIEGGFTPRVFVGFGLGF